MNKFTTIVLSGLVLSLSGVAMASDGHSGQSALNFPKKEELKSVSNNAVRKGLQKKISGYRFLGEDVIYEAAGVSRLYSKEAMGYTVDDDDLGQYYDEDAPGNIVWGADGAVYFYNILSAYPTESYVIGELDENTIEVPMGQLVMWIDDDPDYEPYGVGLGVFKAEFVGGKGTGYNLDLSFESVTYTVGDDGTLTLNIPGWEYDDSSWPQYAIGYYYSDNLQWTGLLDFYQIWTPSDVELTTMPEGVEPEAYLYIDEDYQQGRLLNVAFDDEYLYIQGLCNLLPNGVIRAMIDGNQAYISQNQIIGIYEGLDYIYTKCIYKNYDEDDMEYPFAPDDICYILEIDRERSSIKSAEQEYLFCLNYYTDEYEPLMVYSEISLLPGTFGVGCPANPFRLDYVDMLVPWFGYTYIGFTMPNITVDKELLNEENLYFRIYVNGEAKVFEEGMGLNLIDEEVLMYPGVEEPTELISCTFFNGVDIEAAEGKVIVGFYEEGIDTIGVQSVYLDNTGEETIEYCSHIMNYDIETGEVTDGVKSITMSDIVSIEYFDLGGRKVAKPEKGVYVMRTIISDGSTLVKKIAIR